MLGVDGGHDGAAVLLASGSISVLAALSWQRLARKSGDVYLCTSLSGDEQTEPSIHGVAQRILCELAGVRRRPGPPCGGGLDLSAPWYRLAVEGLFVWPGRTGGIIELAEAVGELIGPLRYGALTVSRAAPSEWRSAVLPKRWGRSSVEAERAALIVCRALQPELGAFLDATPDAEGRLVPTWPHVVEAACIARWGLATARTADQQDLIAQRSSGRTR